MTSNDELVLVTGATGTTGRRVTDRLRALGVRVRAGSRAGTPPFDWHDESTWEAVLDSVTAAYLAYHSDLMTPSAVETMRRFVLRAVAAGTRRLVLLSGRGEPTNRETEQVVLSAGAQATIVRSAFFAQDFSEKEFVEAVRAGAVELPAGPVGEPFVDAEDIADVVVAALTGDGHAGEIYEVTGPRLLSFAEAVAEIALATGRDISYRTITPSRFADALATQGMPTELVAPLVAVFGTVLDGRNAHVADGVARALGRPPRDFADYAKASAASGVWDG
jgi:uncharacterized protein YbjT (DUF2867 family)